MAKARAAAEALRQELEADLREDMEQKRAAWLDHLQEDRTEIVLEMQKRIIFWKQSTWVTDVEADDADDEGCDCGCTVCC